MHKKLSPFSFYPLNWMKYWWYIDKFHINLGLRCEIDINIDKEMKTYCSKVGPNSHLLTFEKLLTSHRPTQVVRLPRSPEKEKIVRNRGNKEGGNLISPFLSISSLSFHFLAGRLPGCRELCRPDQTSQNAFSSDGVTCRSNQPRKHFHLR